MYTVDFFIDKFSKIPEEKWCAGALINEKGQRCAQGHCGPANLLSHQLVINSECSSMLEILQWKGVDINNGDDSRYQQPTPKQRILAALYDIKKMNNEQEVQECDATKMTKEPEARTKTVYVSVPESLTKQTKELILQ